MRGSNYHNFVHFELAKLTSFFIISFGRKVKGSSGRVTPNFGRADGKGAPIGRPAAMVEIETFEDGPDPVETSRPATAVCSYCSLPFWSANVLGKINPPALSHGNPGRQHRR